MILKAIIYHYFQIFTYCVFTLLLEPMTLANFRGSLKPAMAHHLRAATNWKSFFFFCLLSSRGRKRNPAPTLRFRLTEINEAFANSKIVGFKRQLITDASFASFRLFILNKVLILESWCGLREKSFE